MWSSETVIAFAGENRSILVRILVAVVMVVSTVAIQGRAVVMGGFMLTCISGCGGVIGCIVATSQLPAREKVRPAPLG